MCEILDETEKTIYYPDWQEEGSFGYLAPRKNDILYSPEKPAYCMRCRNIFFVSTRTGEIVSGKCNTYKCEYCGFRKARRLQNALKTYFSQFKIIRFWTFTFKASVFASLSNKDKFKMSSEIWRRFLNNVRRSPSLSPHQRKFNYVKVMELTQAGFPHYHCFFDRFIDRNTINEIWENVIRNFLHFDGKVGNAYVEGATTPKKASDYISKYLMKTVRELSRILNCRIWSKSAKVRLFPLKPKNSEWLVYKLSGELLYLLSLRVTSLEKLPDLPLELFFNPT